MSTLNFSKVSPKRQFNHTVAPFRALAANSSSVIEVPLVMVESTCQGKNEQANASHRPAAAKCRNSKASGNKIPNELEMEQNLKVGPPPNCCHDHLRALPEVDVDHVVVCRRLHPCRQHQSKVLVLSPLQVAPDQSQRDQSPKNRL